MKLKNKVAVVTGASSGIGAAIAKRYAEEGAKVVLAARREDKLREVQQSIQGETAICVCDVSDLNAIDNLVAFTKKTYGSVDIIVANAGRTHWGNTRDVTEEEFDSVTNTNYKGCFFTVQRFLSNLNKGAAIIMISSIASRMGLINHSIYSASKAAVAQLTRNFAIDLVSDKIRVNAILPGPIDTPIFDEENTGDPNIREKITKLVPIGRYGEVEDICGLAVYLACEDSSFMTGQCITVDGGMVDLRGFDNH